MCITFPQEWNKRICCYVSNIFLRNEMNLFIIMYNIFPRNEHSFFLHIFFIMLRG